MLKYCLNLLQLKQCSADYEVIKTDRGCRQIICLILAENTASVSCAHRESSADSGILWITSTKHVFLKLQVRFRSNTEMELFMIKQKQHLVKSMFCEQKAEMTNAGKQQEKKSLEKQLEFFLNSVDVNYFSVKGFKMPRVIFFLLLT